MIGHLGGGIGWIGGIMLIFGTYAAFGGGGFALAGMGFALICLGEGISLLRKRKKQEIELLKENINRDMVKNMAFPLLWMLLFFLSGLELLLALGIATGARALVKNAGILSTFYISSS